MCVSVYYSAFMPVDIFTCSSIIQLYKAAVVCVWLDKDIAAGN